MERTLRPQIDLSRSHHSPDEHYNNIMGVNPRQPPSMGVRPLEPGHRAPVSLSRLQLESGDLAGRQGLEPRFHGPEPCVLPLDDRPMPNPHPRQVIG